MIVLKIHQEDFLRTLNLMLIWITENMDLPSALLKKFLMALYRRRARGEMRRRGVLIAIPTRINKILLEQDR